MLVNLLQNITLKKRNLLKIIKENKCFGRELNQECFGHGLIQCLTPYWCSYCWILLKHVDNTNVRMHRSNTRQIHVLANYAWIVFCINSYNIIVCFHLSVLFLSQYLSGYYDTCVGTKREASSYQRIAVETKTSPDNILFLTDIPEGTTSSINVCHSFTYCYFCHLSCKLSCLHLHWLFLEAVWPNTNWF